MATSFVEKLWQNYLPPALIALSFRNRMGYRYLNVHSNSVNHAYIFRDIQSSNSRVDRAYL